MSTKTAPKPQHWFDKIAIFLAATCAVHCLLMPVIIVALPIVATSFFADKNFHLWMLYLVLPTTAIAVFLGCRDHKDKWVITLSSLGLLILAGATFYEMTVHGGCTTCSTGAEGHNHSHAHTPLSTLVWVNLSGVFCLIAAHTRNFKLCRQHTCNN
jgi:hypothetical protein